MPDDERDDFESMAEENAEGLHQPDEAEWEDDPDSGPDPDPPDDPEEGGDEDAAEGTDDSAAAVPEPGAALPHAGQPAGHTPDLVARAARLGMRPEYMGAFTPAGLQQVVAEMEQRVVGGYPPGGPRPTMPGAPNGAPAVPGQAPVGAGAYKVDLDPEEYDEKYIGAMQGMADHTARQFQELQNVIGYLAGQVQQRTENTEQVGFDTWLQGLGDDYVELFGEGSSNDLDPNHPHYHNRNRVFLEARRRQETVPGESLDVSFRKALAAEFSDHNQAVVSKRVSKKAARIAQGQTSRPSPRPTKKDTRSPSRRAQSAVAAKLREMGALDDEGW